MFPLIYEVPRVVTFIETENRTVVVRCLIGTEFQFGKTNVLETMVLIVAQ
jgi:hypothetical protein